MNVPFELGGISFSNLHQVFKVDYLELSAEILRWDFKGL